MYAFLFIAFIVSILFPTLSSAGTAAELQPLAKASLLQDITLVGDKSAVAVGERGHILKYEQGLWQQKKVPSSSMLTAVFALDPLHLWSVGHNAVILHSADGGERWQQQYDAPSIEKPLFDIVFYSATEGLAVGAYGLMLKTFDGGKSWQMILHDTLLLEDDRLFLEEIKAESEDEYLTELDAMLPHLNQLFVDNDVTWLVGEAGLIAKSIDRGATWQRLPDIYHGSFFDINKHANVLVVAGLRGNVFSSQTNGKHWQSHTLASSNSINKIIYLPYTLSFVLIGNSEQSWCLNLQNKQIYPYSKHSQSILSSGLIFPRESINGKPDVMFTVGTKGIQESPFLSPCIRLHRETDNLLEQP